MIRTNLQTFEAPPSLEGVRELRRKVALGLGCTGLSEARRGQILVAVSELATNLVQHSRPRPDWVRVLLARERGDWRLEVADNGSPLLDWRERLTTAAIDGEDCLANDRGRGLALVASMFPGASYEPRPSPGEFNRWRLRLGESSVSVAVIDDDPVQLRVISAYLSDAYQVIAFAKPLMALEQLRRAPPDLVLADIHMPDLDGLELRRRLGDDPATELVPFIFMTETRDEMVREQADLLGIDDFLLKPVRKRRLVDAVARTLYRSRSLRARLGHRIDAAITEALKPKLPLELGRWRAVVRSVAAEAGGGDFISFTQSAEEACVVLVDVMGHGVAAKFFAHAHAGYIGGLLHSRSEAWEPANLCRAISKRVFEDKLNQYSLLTCVAVRLAAAGVMEVACAGHPAPLLLDGAGAHQLDIGGALPGLQLDPVYDTLSFKLNAGERLLLFTDGLFDGALTGPGRKALEQDLLATAGNSLDVPLAEQADALMKTFFAATGDIPRDDATIILLEPAK
ncbi:MAG TPA: SpoIIE family protein phosphatase [Lamprocystis sp. (in: g-proteobacteria)]|nr:SpoIIE family protein phosphatase [Lamprocystis sp. (in: g-proteobacteria)]